MRIVNGEVVDDNAPAPPSSLGAFPSFSSGSLLYCISSDIADFLINVWCRSCDQDFTPLQV